MPITPAGRRLASGLSAPACSCEASTTLPFNGHADEAASLYRGMNLQNSVRFTVKQIRRRRFTSPCGVFAAVWLIRRTQGDPAPISQDIQDFTGRMALSFCWRRRPLSAGAYAVAIIDSRSSAVRFMAFCWATLHLTSYTRPELGINNLVLLARRSSPAPI